MSDCSSAVQAVLAARGLLSSVTPLSADCGSLCGGACCQPDEEGKGGMLLYPGEEALLENARWARLTPNDDIRSGGWLLTCSGVCPREERPLACRLFPLVPLVRVRDGRDRLSVEPDCRGRGVCPLLRGGLAPFLPDFVHAVRAASQILYKNEMNRDFMRRMAFFIDENYQMRWQM